MKRVLFSAVIFFGALGTAQAEEAFTYGDLVTGEELRVTSATLDRELIRRLTGEERVARVLASLFQKSGRGITCDLIMTRHYLESTASNLNQAALSAQTFCVSAGMADMLKE
ncbi:hypothetical protein KC722_00635 [Candidatus Kaiserbacteria bacterium]|nr:hypothetical protein [Candidatus Kaiserbacteria bacterium]MCB9811785.1 hypothetical protein [Candidatus Nomurabacteria bacterium]